MAEPKLKEFGKRLAYAIENVAKISRAETARRLEVKPQQISKWLAREYAPSEETVERLASVLEVPVPWLRYGELGTDHLRPGDTVAGTGGFLAENMLLLSHEEHAALARELLQAETERELERVLDVVRLVGGKAEFTEEQRRGLKRDIINTYIDAFVEDGLDARDLYVMLGRVDRGEL